MYYQVVCKALSMLYLIKSPYQPLKCRYYCYSHFTDVETVSQK